MLEPGPFDQLRINRLLHHAVVEKACLTVGVAIHRNQPHNAGGRVERLRQPAPVARNFFEIGAAGHAAP